MSAITFRRAVLVLGTAGVVSACNESVAPLDLAGPATSFAIVGGDGQVGAVGDSLPQLLTVVVKDAEGRTVPGYTVTWSATAGTLSAERDTTDAAGTAGVALTLPATPDTIEITAKVEGFAPVVFHVYATAALKLLKGGGQTGAMGQRLADSLVAVVADSAGHPLPGYVVRWHTTGGTLSVTETTSDVDGIVGVTLTLPDQPDTVTVTATAAGFAPLPFTEIAAAAMRITAGDEQEDAVNTELPVPLTVTILNGAGQPVRGYRVSWVATGGHLSTTESFTDTSGVATVTMTLPATPDSVSVTATAQAMPAVVFHATATALMTMATGDLQVGAVGTTLPVPLAIIVRDADGDPIQGYSVTWITDGGTLTPSGPTTGADGVSRATVLLPSTPAVITVTASAPALPAITFSAAATPTGAPLVFRYVETGSYHACGITTTEKSICWGFNEDGQVGAGVFSTIAPLTRVSTDRTVRMTSAGRYHSCEITLSGDVWCGGSNSAAQVTGTNPSPPVTPFIRVNTLQQIPATGFRTVQAGLLHTCALSLSQQIWCWGSNGEGQIGSGPIVPVPGSFARPTFIADGFAAVTATGLHTCALTTSGQAECWGWNASGQLGDNTQVTRGVPAAVSGGLTFRTEPALVPTAPDPDFYIPGQSFISAGYAHSCGIVTSNAAVCWGENEDGQLGTGNSTDADTPVTVSGGLQFKAISAGYRHTCALTTAGAAYCWGNNALGQLGDGTTTRRLTPTAVTGGLVFMSISAGDTFSCGVTTAGVAYCWGDNEYGQLGSTAISGSMVPVKLPFQ